MMVLNEAEIVIFHSCDQFDEDKNMIYVFNTESNECRVATEDVGLFLDNNNSQGKQIAHNRIAAIAEDFNEEVLLF